MMQRVADPHTDSDMPWQARTPDLVRQQIAAAPPTTQSDVFALGLLLYRLFTGGNPLLPAGSMSDPIALKRLPSVDGELAPMLDQMLSATLLDDPDRRPTPEALQSLFIGLVQSEARKPHAESEKS